MDATTTAAVQQLLSFRLGRETFAIDVTKAREILDFIPPTKVPQTPKFMLGVINLRGSVVPVVDLRRKFGLPEAAPTRESCIIIVDVTVDGQLATIGAVADSVKEVLELGIEQVEPPPRLGIDLRIDFIKGIANLDSGFLILLDIDQIFSAEEIGLETGELGEQAMVASA